MSPLIGKYCGYSVGHPTCAAGACPPLTNIVSSGSVILVVFYVDEDIVAQGFRLNYTTIPQRAVDGSLAATDEKAMTMPDGNLGAGLYFLLCPSVVMRSVTAQGNVAQHPIIAAGAGLFLHASVVTMSNVRITNNSAIGLIASGAGITVFDGSVVTVQESLVVEGNSAVSSGSCFSTTGLLVCGRVWGGGTMVYNAQVTAAASASISMRQNSANCNTTFCHAVGGGLAAIARSTVDLQKAQSVELDGNQSPVGGGLYASSSSQVTLAGLLCQRNQATCSASQQKYGQSCGWVGGGCAYVDSAQVTLNQSRVLSNNARGSDGGGGGGVSLTGSAAVVLLSAVLNNSETAQ